MQTKQPGGFRRFVQTPAGRALLPAIAILVVFGTYVYVSTLLAIPAILVFGLAVPIWSGLKRPRYLALSGLVVILLVAPIATAAITQEIRTPIGPISSFSTTSVNGTGPVLLNAQVNPYNGGTSTNFSWTVTLQPQFAPNGTRGVLGVSLYISSCPGATGNNSPYCSGGYTLHNLTHNFTKPPTSTTSLTFDFTIGGVGIWDWQMAAFLRNASGGHLLYLFLAGDPTYNGIEGPVVGTWTDTYSELLPTVYFNTLLLLALPYFLVLVLYMFFKRRETQKKDALRRAAGPTPADLAPSSRSAPAPGGSPPATSPSSAPSSGAKERACPNCNAVVYENEATCWKCGATLSTGESTPLPSTR